jgi:hypothetical protein
VFFSEKPFRSSFTGWCFVRFDDALLAKTRAVAASLEPFFQSSAEKKLSHRVSELLGYNEVRGVRPDDLSEGPVFKEKLTYVTGAALNKTATPELTAFIHEADTMTRSVRKQKEKCCLVLVLMLVSIDVFKC